MRRATILIAVLAALLALPAPASAGVKAKKGGVPFWIPGLTFWAPFSNPSDPLALTFGTGALSFTRATSATYVSTDNGYISTAADNVLRIEANGALIEGQRTNLLTYSEQFDQGSPSSPPWYKDQGATVDSNTSLAPDGTLSADTITWDNTGLSNVFQAAPVTSGSAYTFSLWMRVTSGTQTVEIGNINAGVLVPVTVTTAWQRFSVTQTASANTRYPEFKGTGAGSVIVWGAQLEAGSFASSYIPTTTAAVTRNADQLSFVNNGNVDGTIGTLCVEVEALAPVATDYPRIINFTQSGYESPLFYRDTGGKISSYDGSSVYQSDFDADTTRRKLASRWGNSERKIARDSALSAAGSFDGDYSLSGDSTSIGYIPVGNDGWMFGHIKNLRIWNRAFSDSEMQAITQ